MSNEFSNLILATLGNHLEDGVSLADDPVAVANALSAQLTAASWQQLAAVTGASVERDSDGQLVLYTGCYAPQSETSPEELDAAAAFNRYEDTDGNYTLLRTPTAESHERMKRIARGEDDV